MLGLRHVPPHQTVVLAILDGEVFWSFPHHHLHPGGSPGTSYRDWHRDRLLGLMFAPDSKVLHITRHKIISKISHLLKKLSDLLIALWCLVKE